MTTSDPQPFRVDISTAALDDLQQRLKLTRFPDELNDAGWDYGAPLADIKRLVARWQDGYNWRREETKINDELPQFTTDIEVEEFGTLNIHFVHKKSPVADAIPLLFCHGWPGHFLEVRKILPLLLEESPLHPSFHVVALSIPGYGFSQGPKKKGFRRRQYAEVCNKLMLSLGYGKYVAQGGDWGQIITRSVAEFYGGESIQAWHTNMPNCRPPSITRNPIYWAMDKVLPRNNHEQAGFAVTERFMKYGNGYGTQQKTRPQTLGYGMTDSPVGILAWIYEKLVDWTDSYPWTDDEVLTWVSIYWFSREGPAATFRIYYELAAEDVSALPAIKIPAGASYFPGEIVRFPKIWFRASIGTVVFESEHERGGHFAAHEQPEALVGDLRKMYGKEGPAYGVVKGKTGYTNV